MASAARLFLLGAGCLLLATGTWAASAECENGAPEGDAQCLMQGGLKPVKRSSPAKSDVTCFAANLEVDPAAVPENSESRQSFGFAVIKVTQGWVGAYVSWYIPGVDSSNPVIGMHIHEGDSATNGPILVGFCGQDPLPPFSGACKQEEVVQTYYVGGQACDVTGDGSPCANTDGTATINEAAAALMSSSDPSTSYYFNLHTMVSFDDTDQQALGLIRGQLHPATCPS